MAIQRAVWQAKLNALKETDAQVSIKRYQNILCAYLSCGCPKTKRIGPIGDSLLISRGVGGLCGSTNK